MSIRLCRDCGHQVSTEAAACPKCGVADPGRNLQQGEKISPEARAKAASNIGCIVVVIGFAVLALLVILLLVGYAIFGGGEGEPDPQTASRAQPACRSLELAIARAGESTEAELRVLLADVVRKGVGQPFIGDEAAELGAAGASSDQRRFDAALRDLKDACSTLPS